VALADLSRRSKIGFLSRYYLSLSFSNKLGHNDDFACPEKR